MPLNNTQYDEIMRGYDAIRAANQYASAKKKKEIYERIPELKTIDDQITTLIFSYARTSLLGDSNNSKNFEEQLKLLKAKKLALLADANYSSKDLEPIYTCALCKDTGYIDNKKCACFVKAATDLLYNQSNIKNLSRNETFNKFCFDYYPKDFFDENLENKINAYDNAINAVNICKKFVADFDSFASNILLYGDPGVGKTFLTNCIANELIKTSHSVIYLTSIELFDLMSKYKFSNNEDDMKMDTITECDLLIIDDLGTELVNSFTDSSLFYVINDRLLQKKSTIISTNFDIDGLYNKYSERVFSRIMHSYTPIKLFTDDIRLKNPSRNVLK